MAVHFHKLRESAATKIIHPIKIKGVRDFLDVLTKFKVLKTFITSVGGVMHQMESLIKRSDNIIQIV